MGLFDRTPDADLISAINRLAAAVEAQNARAASDQQVKLTEAQVEAQARVAHEVRRMQGVSNLAQAQPGSWPSMLGDLR